MIRLSILGLLMTATLAASAEPKKYWVFLGTSTGKSTSRGIYRAEFDTATGKLGAPVLAAEVVQPTFLAVHPNGKFLYSVGEINSMDGKKAGGVHAFSLDAASGELKKLNDTDSGGPGPCHVMIDPAGQCALVANYTGGSVKCIKLHDDGKLGSESSFIQHTGSSGNPTRQKEPHAHSVNVSPDGNFAVVADLGTDKLNVYKLDAKTAKIEANQPAHFLTHRGAGPRHFAWHPNRKWAYTNGELDATVTAMNFDAKDGVFTKINVSSTLPGDASNEVRAKNSTAEIVVHPGGKHVFVSNRGHNSIAIFKVKDDGALEPAGHIMGDIKTPRNFNIDPSGRWILIANLDGENVSVYEWDEASGQAKATENKITIAKPMCIKFVERKVITR